jgi:hypothetical protein
MARENRSHALRNATGRTGEKHLVFPLIPGLPVQLPVMRRDVVGIERTAGATGPACGVPEVGLW